jgi:hypothetical protein
MKKIGIALTLVLWGLEVTHAQNGGQLKQAQVSTARQTPQQITDQYLASQKSLTQRKVALSQALEQELAQGQNTNASNSIILPAYSSFRFSPQCESMMSNSWVSYRV